MIILLDLGLIIVIDQFLLNELDHPLTDLEVQKEYQLMKVSSARLQDQDDMIHLCLIHFKVIED